MWKVLIRIAKVFIKWEVSDLKNSTDRLIVGGSDLNCKKKRGFFFEKQIFDLKNFFFVGKRVWSELQEKEGIFFSRNKFPIWRIFVNKRVWSELQEKERIFFWETNFRSEEFLSVGGSDLNCKTD